MDCSHLTQIADKSKLYRAFGPCTWFDFPEDWQNTLIHYTQWVGQVETCPKTKREHIQFCIYTKTPMSFASIKRKLPEGIHIEVAKNWLAVANYCRKSKTAKPGTLTEKLTGKQQAAPTSRDPLEGKELYPWQQHVMNILAAEPDGRSIHWYVDTTGNCGKSALTKHIYKSVEGALLCGGKGADCRYLICNWLKTHPIFKVALFDFPRSRQGYISYEGIEKILDGLFVAEKYETDVADFDPPHMIIFANWHPDRSQCSNDRWKIHVIENNSIVGEEPEAAPPAVTPAGHNVGKEEESDDEYDPEKDTDTDVEETHTADYISDETLQSLLDGDYDWS